MHHHRLSRWESSLCLMEAVWPSFGRPGTWADRGPQFWCKEFLELCQRKGITIETFSPYNPHSNGLAESAVKNCKKLCVECIDGGEVFGPSLFRILELPQCGWTLPGTAHVLPQDKDDPRPAPPAQVTNTGCKNSRIRGFLEKQLLSFKFS